MKLLKGFSKEGFRRKAASAAMCITGMLLLCACGQKKASEVNVAYFPNITHSQALVMKNQGALEETLGEDYDVKWVSFNAGPAEVSALFSEDIDIGYIGPTPAISANVKSEGEVVVISGCSEGGMMLLASPGSGIEEIADLAGKNVAVPQLGNTQHLILLNLLSQNNLAASDAGGDVTVTATANAYILQLMTSGDVDAACVPEPWAQTLIQECGARVIADEKEVWGSGSYPVAVVVVRKEYLTENPDIVEKFLFAHRAATDFIEENPETAMTLVNQEIEAVTGKSIEPSILKEAWKHMGFSTELNTGAMQTFSDICVREGYAEMPPYEDMLQIK